MPRIETLPNAVDYSVSGVSETLTT